MPVEIRHEGRRLLVGVIRGMLRKSELDAFQTAAADLIRRETTISCLIVLGGMVVPVLLFPKPSAATA